jgi:putative lipoic acid-binding regulatory protein
MPRHRHAKPPQSLLTFPATMTLRAMGHNLPGFSGKVLGALHVHFPDLTQAEINVRPSRRNKYLSVSANVTVLSQAQLDAIYRELRGIEGLVAVF